MSKNKSNKELNFEKQTIEPIENTEKVALKEVDNSVVEIGSLVEDQGVSTMGLSNKIGVVRFLQLNPQDFYVEELMKKKYKKDSHTESEWFAIMEKLMNSKVTG